VRARVPEMEVGESMLCDMVVWQSHSFDAADPLRH